MLRALTLLLAFTVHAHAAEIAVKVVAITDGDTVGVIDAEKSYFKVRLHGIDSPEKKQAYHEKATQALSGKVFQKDVVLDERGKDRYGRVIAVLKLDGRNINRELVEEGFAWQWDKYDKLGEFTEAHASAKEKKAGLWQDAVPVAPWEFRAKKPAAATK
jgi:micrococcal nuclease